MELQTIVKIPKGTFQLRPEDNMLFVGSCFADNLGRRFWDDQFRVSVNPYGVMYNPVSVLHTVKRWLAGVAPKQGSKCQPFGEMPQVAIFTLGTNHVYVLRENEEVVDNCEKRPAKLFREEVLGVEECEKALREAVELLRQANPAVKVILTVSPIRYAKYGYPESARSKAVLLLAAHGVVDSFPDMAAYFPAYEIMNDELRDYRFYRPDMLHPSEQAVDYIHERFSDAYFSERATTYAKEWRHLRAALRHRPFNPGSDAYQTFKRQTQEQVNAFAQRYPTFPDNPMEEAV